MPTFHRFTVTLAFDDRVVGGIPALYGDPEEQDAQLRAWIKTQSGAEAPASLVEEMKGDPDFPETEESPLNAFKRDDTGLYIEARQVKAMLREAAQRLGYLVSKRGSRQVLQHDLHVRNHLDPDSQKLHFTTLVEDTGEMVYVTDDDANLNIDERPISVMTRQGPRTALKKSEYVVNAHLACSVYVLHDGIGKGLIDDDALANMLDLGQWLGLGADRSQGAGTFTVTSIVGPQTVSLTTTHDVLRPYKAEVEEIAS